MFFFLLILLVIYGKTSHIAGWGRGDALVLAATVFVMNSFVGAFCFSITEIPQQVRMGSLDFIVTKPVDSQFWVSFRRFNFDQMGSLFAGVAMILVGAHLAGVAPSPAQWIAYGLLVLSSTALFYSFNLAMMTTGIWLVRVDNLFVLGESITQIVRYPLEIYPSGLQRLLTFVIPLGFLATVPARQLVRGLDVSMVGIGLVWALVALYVSRRFWQYAMKNYSSASS